MKDKQSVQLNQLQRLIEDVDKVARDSGSPAPGEFLARVMSGEDPRPLDSPLYGLIKKIAFREFSFSGQGENYPTPDEWGMICEMVLSTDEYQKSRVDIDHSLNAASRLMEYLHAKMKRVEIQGGLDVQLEIKPLTGKDLDAFHKRFNNDF